MKLRLNKKNTMITVTIMSILVGCLGVSAKYPGGEANKAVEYRDVVIVGGGIAGLTCGYYLENDDYVILEKNSSIGGRTLSGMHNNFTYAKGTEYLGTPESPLTEMIDELGLEPQEIPSPMDAYFDGKDFYYGEEGIKRYLITNSSYDAYEEFTELVLEAYEDYDEVTDLYYNAKAKRLDNMSARQWLVNHKIPEVFIKKYNVSAKGLFGANMDEISALSFIPEAAYDYEEEELEEIDYDDYDAEDLEEEYVEATQEASGSYSFVKGLTELTDKLGEVMGDKIRYNSRVTSVVKKGRNYEVSYAGKDGKASKIIAESVVLAVPAPEALKIASNALSKEKVNLMSQVDYASYATVALFSDEPIFNKAFDLAVPDDYFFTDIYDATWTERYYDEDKKDIPASIMSVYVAPKVSTDHTLDTLSDEKLLNNIYKDLDKIFPGASQKITGYDIERFPYAYPVMTKGAYKRLMRLNDLNTGTLILAGDYMIYPTFEAAVESGYNAAEEIN
ncbi:MAG: flavin monoamine oxidase family protein [Cellulosilyticaceae bacterium]